MLGVLDSQSHLYQPGPDHEAPSPPKKRGQAFLVSPLYQHPHIRRYCLSNFHYLDDEDLGFKVIVGLEGAVDRLLSGGSSSPPSWSSCFCGGLLPTTRDTPSAP